MVTVKKEVLNEPLAFTARPRRQIAFEFSPDCVKTLIRAEAKQISFLLLPTSSTRESPNDQKKLDS